MPEQLLGELSGIYSRLLIADVSEILPGETSESSISLSDRELIRLLQAASRLALSAQAAERTLAYEIASRIVELKRHGSNAFFNAAELIFARLGNFPGRQL